MGSGKGCIQSKEEPADAHTQKAQTAPQSAATAQSTPAPPTTQTSQQRSQSTVNGSMSDTKTKIYIIYYSTYGHVAQLAKKEKEGVDSVPGCEGILYQVKETLPAEVLSKMHAPPQPAEIPFADVHDLPNADGFIFGSPTRYGNVAAQFKTFWDATGGLWQAGKLAGKPFGMFTSTASIGGGQEVTIANSLPNFVHHGMIYIPVGYTMGPALFGLDEVRGGSPWGAGTYAAGDGSRQPSALELEQALHQGKYTAGIIKKFAGKA